MDLNDSVEAGDFGPEPHRRGHVAELDLPSRGLRVAHELEQRGKPRAAEEADPAEVEQEPCRPFLGDHHRQVVTQLLSELWPMQVLGEDLGEGHVIYHARVDVVKWGSWHLAVL